MNELQPFSSIKSFQQIAEDFNTHLARGDNQDVATEFPATVVRYGSGVDEAVHNLEEARGLYETGSREQFIVLSGKRAVGLCLITNQIDNPPGINDSWPNISGFIMNPFRGRGLGRFSIEERMKVVEENFGNHAWTFVRDGNDHSEHLVMSVGFEKTEQAVEGWDGHSLFIYDGNSSSSKVLY